jgi:thymidylate synthase (FAD)
MGYSQLSQRYVSGRVLRFVERPEYVDDPDMHRLFEQRIDRAAREYEQMAELLLQQQKSGTGILSADVRTDLRKKVQQTARSVLPNETEAPIVVTGNARAWRHTIEMRANAHAETEIRALFFNVYLCLSATDPILFGDYEVQALPDGTFSVDTEYRKV